MTTSTCSLCLAPVASPEARFCAACGGPLGATVQGRTVPLYEHRGESEPRVPTSTSEQAAPVTTLALRPALPLALPSSPGPREVVVGLIDTSGSMSEAFNKGYTKLQAAQRAVMTMILDKFRLDPGDLIGWVGFNHAAHILTRPAPTRTHKQAMLLATQGLQAGGDTDLEAALRYAAALLEEAMRLLAVPCTGRIVCLTDGKSSTTVRCADRLKAGGVDIDTVGIGASRCDVDERTLTRIASVIDGQPRYRFIKDTDELERHYTTLAQKTAVHPAGRP